MRADDQSMPLSHARWRAARTLTHPTACPPCTHQGVVTAATGAGLTMVLRRALTNTSISGGNLGQASSERARRRGARRLSVSGGARARPCQTPTQFNPLTALAACLPA